jgi:hypothetical protein
MARRVKLSREQARKRAYANNSQNRFMSRTNNRRKLERANTRDDRFFSPEAQMLQQERLAREEAMNQFVSGNAMARLRDPEMAREAGMSATLAAEQRVLEALGTQRFGPDQRTLSDILNMERQRYAQAITENPLAKWTDYGAMVPNRTGSGYHPNRTRAQADRLNEYVGRRRSYQGWASRFPGNKGFAAGRRDNV